MKRWLIVEMGLSLGLMDDVELLSVFLGIHWEVLFRAGHC
jgi:hypothetical protein